MNKYHYTLGDFENLTLRGLLSLSKEDKLKLGEYLTKQLKEEGYSSDYPLKVIEEELLGFEGMLLKDLNVSEEELLDNNFHFHIYRGIQVKTEEDIWLDYLGECWTTDKSCADCYTDSENIIGARYLVIFEGETLASNIDWVESFLLYTFYGTSEHELRIKDSSINRIHLRNYELETLLEDIYRQGIEYTMDTEDRSDEEYHYIHKYVQGKELNDRLRRTNTK